MNLKDYIRDIADFPQKGILFKDITPLLAAPKAFNYAIDLMSDFVKNSNAQAIAAIESRGFIFACPLACKLNLPFILIRKPGKLPYKTKSVEYSLEYGCGKLEIHEDAIIQGMRVAIVDDLLATGGTAKGAAGLIEECKGSVCAYSFLIELSALGGNLLLNSDKIQSILQY